MTVQERIQEAKDKNLTQLDLSDCGLTTVPVEVFELYQLKTLILGKNYQPNQNQSQRNRLTDLPLELALLKELEGIGLAHNSFKEFPTILTHLPRLQTLMFNNNKLESLPAQIQELRHLRILGLNNNNLTDLPTELGNLRRLKVLGLTNNRLASLPDFFKNFQFLEQLGLSGNDLTQFPMVLLELPELQVIGLASNQIDTFPKELMQMKRLQRLDLEDNPLNKNIINIAAKGQQAIQQFFFQKANQRKKLLKTIVEGKREAAERKKIQDRFFRLFNSNSTICSVCDGSKQISGFIGHLNMRFNKDKCFGCSGEGTANEDTEELHKLLEQCNQRKERCRNFIIALVEDEQGFSKKIRANGRNKNILFEETLQNIKGILAKKRRQIDVRVRQFSSYQLFEQKILITLYNLHLHKITIEERYAKDDFSLSYNDSPIDIFNITRSIEMILSEQETLFDTLIDIENPEGVQDIEGRLQELKREMKELR